MNNKILKHFVFCLSLFFLSFLFFSDVEASSLSSRLSGRILLQVESKGEAYYVNPTDLKRYYLGRPDDAFKIMRSFGLGATNVDINNFLKNGARANLSGKILLQVQDKGQAYYVNPLNLRLYYLGRPADAFSVMRQLGLGIKNYDLSLIPVGDLGVVSNNSGSTVKPGEKLVLFSWKYKNKQYSLEQIFSDSLYNSYKNSDKNYYYPANNPPENLREEYYNIFLTQKSGDDSIEKLISGLRSIADKEGFSDDEFVEFVLALVQYLPYDFSKKSTDAQNFPYETLYTGTGICSDTTFLSVLILRKLGYGAAVFDYPDAKHSAAAVLCSGNSSYGSGYCFAETTNYFPIGVFPSSIGTGQAEGSTSSWGSLFSGSNLGQVEILQKTGGKSYSGISNTINKVNSIIKMQENLVEKGNELKSLQNQLNLIKTQLDQILAQAETYKQSNDWTNYNLKVEEYNSKAEEYNSVLANYRLKLDVYNFDVVLFNQTVKDFYQN